MLKLLMLTLFVVLVCLALVAAPTAEPMPFSKWNNLTDVFDTNTQLSTSSIADIGSRSIAKRTGHGDHSTTPSMVSVPIKPVRGYGWVTTVLIGGAEFEVLLDTGEINFWVLSSRCRDPRFAGRHKYIPKDGKQKDVSKDGKRKYVSKDGKKKYVPKDGIQKYVPKQKSVLKDMPKQRPETFIIGYGHGLRVEGTVHSDTVTLGSITLNNLYFGGALKVRYGDIKSDGLAFPNLKAIPPDSNPKFIHHPNFLHEAIKQGKISPIFSISPASPRRQLHLGGIDHAAYIGSIKYYEVASDGYYWRLKDPGHITLRHNIARSLKCLTRIDTAATYIFGPAQAVSEIYKELGGTELDGLLVFPCDKEPEISLGWGPGEDDWKIRRFSLGHFGETSYCIGVIQKTQLDHCIIGIIFLQDVYTVFDLENMKVGFGKLRRQH